MTQLRQETCVSCRRDSPRVTDEEIAQLHPLVSEWSLAQEDDIKRLHREFRFPDFKHALAFTAAVGELAEEEGHHPRLVTEWGSVGVTWRTHKIRDLHRNDFIMASKTDRAAEGLAEGQ